MPAGVNRCVVLFPPLLFPLFISERYPPPSRGCVGGVRFPPRPRRLGKLGVVCRHCSTRQCQRRATSGWPSWLCCAIFRGWIRPSWRRYGGG